MVGVISVALGAWFVPYAHAQIATYMVGIMDRMVYEGETMRVVWIAPYGRTEVGGWVGVFAVGASDRRPIQRADIHPTEQFGYMRFEMDRPGDYEVRMFSERYTRVAVASGMVRVRPDSGPSSFSDRYHLSVADRNVTTLTPLEINWHVPWQKTRTRHWVGVYERGAGDREYGAWMYIDPAGATRGTAELQIPDPGRYEVRLFEGSGYTRVAELSQTITVRHADPAQPSGTYRLRFDRTTASPGDMVRISWSAPAGRGSQDWIGLYEVGAGDRQHHSWQYVSGGASGSITIRAPGRPGTYEARFFLNNGYTKVGESSNRLIVR